MAVVSKVSVTKVGTSVRNKKSIFTATKVTKTQTEPPQYKTEIIRYSDAKGSNPVIIGTRNGETGKIEFNDNATRQDKTYSSALSKTSAIQIKSVENDVTSNAAEKEALNKAAGKGSLKDNEQQNTNANGTQTLGLSAEGSRALASEKGTRMDGFPGSQGEPLMYPLDLGSNKQDLLKFKMVKYKPSGFGGGTAGGFMIGGGRPKGEKQMIGAVVLPIPGGIQSTDNVGWGGDSMNPIQAAAAQIAMQTLQKGFAAGAEATVDVAKAVKSGGADVKKGIASAIAGSATNIGKQAMQRGEGAVLNPNLELLFQQPQLRNFSFTYKLSPRSSREAENVAKIIRFFKQGMAAIRTQSNFFLKAPHTFELEYLFQNRKKHPFLNLFKECALQSCTVGFTPEGNYATYTDGSMTSYDMTLTFNELEPVFNDDYGSGDFPAEIGY